mmetsp:Transcript_2357/g.5533  ORF Transcript_2357/g.5533 Transcript_2357/m.5533 type:complete len:206 (-) Transcript_2357:28-645(-)
MGHRGTGALPHHHDLVLPRSTGHPPGVRRDRQKLVYFYQELGCADPDARGRERQQDPDRQQVRCPGPEGCVVRGGRRTGEGVQHPLLRMLSQARLERREDIPHARHGREGPPNRGRGHGNCSGGTQVSRWHRPSEEERRLLLMCLSPKMCYSPNPLNPLNFAPRRLDFAPALFNQPIHPGAPIYRPIGYLWCSVIQLSQIQVWLN